MSQKEVKRAQVLELLKKYKISQQEAARRIEITPRQASRLAKRYQLEGLLGLVSKRRGTASNRRLDAAACATAIGLIGTHYCDFGPTLAYEVISIFLEEPPSMDSSMSQIKFYKAKCPTQGWAFYFIGV